MELNIELLLSSVKTVQELDAELAKAKGTAAERKAKALESVKTADAELVATTEGLDEGIFARIARLEAELAEARQVVEDRVTEAVKAMSSNSDHVEALKAQRAKAVETAFAVKTLLDSTGTDTSGVAMPSKSSPKVSGSTGVKTSGSRHYVIVDGEKKFYSNTSFSYIAFALKMTGGNGGSELLDRLVKEAGVTERTKAWEATIVIPEGDRAGETVTIGMVVDEQS